MGRGKSKAGKSATNIGGEQTIAKSSITKASKKVAAFNSNQITATSNAISSATSNFILGGTDADFRNIVNSAKAQNGKSIAEALNKSKKTYGTFSDGGTKNGVITINHVDRIGNKSKIKIDTDADRATKNTKKRIANQMYFLTGKPY